MMKKTIYTTLILQLLYFSVKAQLNLPAALRVPIDNAIEKNAEIKNKSLDVQKLQLERQSVINKNIPTLEAVAGYAHIENTLILDVPGIRLPISGTEIFKGKGSVDSKGNLLHGGLMAKSILYSGNQIQNGAKALGQKAAGDLLLIETKKDEVIADVVQSFDKLKLIETSEKLIDDSDKRLSKEEQRVNKAIENGLAVPFDRDKIKLARLELESKSTELEENKKVLYQKLVFLTGLSQKEIEEVSYELAPFILNENLSANDKQEIEALEAYRKAAEFMLKKEKGTFLPQVAAFAGLSYTSLFNASMENFSKWPAQFPEPNFKLNELTAAPNWVAGVVLKWEIFGGFERKHKVEAAKINLQQIENKLTDSKEQLNLLLQHKLAAYTAQWKKIDIANQQQRIAENTLSLATKQYAQGLSSITERLEAENDYYKAELKKVESLLNQRQAAIESLMVTGKLYNKINFK